MRRHFARVCRLTCTSLERPLGAAPASSLMWSVVSLKAPLECRLERHLECPLRRGVSCPLRRPWSVALERTLRGNFLRQLECLLERPLSALERPWSVAWGVP